MHIVFNKILTAYFVGLPLNYMYLYDEQALPYINNHMMTP